MYQRKIIPNYPNYSIDTEGQFRNESKNKLLKLAYTPSGYAYVAIINQLGEKRVFAHIEVSKMFLNYFSGCHVHHKDGDSKNNSINNLECLTPFEHRKISFELNQCKMVDTPIDQYTIDGEYISSFISIMDASRKLGIDFRNISATINGKQKSCKGFIFVRKGIKFKKYVKELGGRKIYKVIKYHKDGTVVNVYNSLKEAALDSDKSKSAINQSILRNTLVRGDYYWAKEPKNEAE